MFFQPSTTLKRKRNCEELVSVVDDLPASCSNANGTEVAPGTIHRESNRPTAARKRLVKAEFLEASILASCHGAAVHSPAAARSVLARHRASIDPELIKILKIVGGYTKEVQLP